MEEHLVTIIVPVYNVAPYLRKCINSILNQTYKNLEILLIDDGSVDESLSICNNFEICDCRVNVLHQENKGVSAARNFGLRHMSGEYVLFVDADDWIEPDMVETLVTELIANKTSDAVFCGYREFEDKTGEILKIISPKRHECVSRNNGVAEIFGSYSTMLWNKLFRSSLIGPKNLFDESLKIGEDELWMIETLKKSNSIVLIGTALYNYRYRGTGASKDFTLSSARMTDYESQKKVLQSIADYHSDQLTQCAQERLYYTGQTIMKIAYYEKHYDIYEMIDREIKDVRTIWYKRHTNKLGIIRRKLVELMMRKKFPSGIIKTLDKQWTK